MGLFMTSHTVPVAILSTGASLWAWGVDGHEITARVAAQHLNNKAAGRIIAVIRADISDDAAKDLRSAVSGADPRAGLTAAMARMAVWPDQMPNGKGHTGPWHFIDMGLSEGAAAMSQRCPGGNCVVARINEISANLKAGRKLGTFTPAVQLRFLIHFLGDIHQPLHAATNHDAGGNCLPVQGIGAGNLHSAWDSTLVKEAMRAEIRPMPAALEATLGSRRGEFQKLTDPAGIAAESFTVAKDKAYGRAQPKVPVFPGFKHVRVSECQTGSPAAKFAVDGVKSYRNAETTRVIREQLYKGGVRLAQILNTIYGQ
ncbi:MAG: S1/P1 nuclease [Acidobacteria bacterium]|nr:S1/P1 nuclease [Acidobacteriota bacterium]